MMNLLFSVMMMLSLPLLAEECKKDFKDACAGVSLTQLKDCLKKAKESIKGGDCKPGKKGMELKAKGIDGIKSCQSDAEKFCKNLKGFEPIKNCLKAKYKDLTVECKDHLSKGWPGFK